MSLELSSSQTFLRAVPLLTVLLAVRCADFESGSAALTADVPLHLEEHIDAANIEGSELPVDVPAAVEWWFDEPQPDWKVVVPPGPGVAPARTTRTEEALRLHFTEANRATSPWGRILSSGIYIDLPDFNREDWAYVELRARTSGEGDSLGVRFNLDEGPNRLMQHSRFRFLGDYAFFINDGSAQTYRMRADWSYSALGEWEGPWRQLGLMMSVRVPSTIDVLSVRLVPKEETYASSGVGVRTEIRGQLSRRVLYTHTPGSLEYNVLVPEEGRLDLSLGVLRGDAPVTFRIRVRAEGGEAVTFLEETHSDKESWAEHSVNLSSVAGKRVSLSLEADAERAGSVALWAAPTVSGSRKADRPNVVLYIIDAGGADYMSVYGYNRSTTPNLERIAAEGVVLEHAYSNSTWTKPSTASFMASLQHSVLGGYRTDTDAIPEEATTMAQHLHRAGYQTAVLVSNSHAGTLSHLEQEVDLLREGGVERNSTSSVELHESFFEWREDYPGEPFWAHFQTTDVHWPWKPSAPFAGLFVSAEVRERFYDWERQLAKASGLAGPAWLTPWLYPADAFEETGIDRRALFDAARGLYDEVMAHNDHQIGRLVERLKATGEWERTLFIVAADHGEGHGLGLLDRVPPRWGPMFRSAQTRVPLIVVWPERIAPGRRIRQAVSMIDLLPTILELVGLDAPEVMQGQSLAPLLLDRQESFRTRPVILDEFYVDQDSGELRGHIEVIDGRWGASLQINPDPEAPEDRCRPVPLLVYDLWNDPLCLDSLHEERPDLVEKYTEFLQRQWEAHQALAQRFSRPGESPLTPEQLRTLRSLGYIR